MAGFNATQGAASFANRVATATANVNANKAAGVQPTTPSAGVVAATGATRTSYGARAAKVTYAKAAKTPRVKGTTKLGPNGQRLAQRLAQQPVAQQPVARQRKRPGFDPNSGGSSY